MSLRLQILLIAVILAILPLAAAIFIVGAGFEDDFTDRDTRRVEERLTLVLRGLENQDSHLARQLAALASAVAEDNSFRLATIADDADLRAYLRDYAPRQMDLLDLDMLQIQDGRGLVVSSGHFRDAHGELQPRLADLIAGTPDERVLMSVRGPAGTFLALVRALPFELAGETWQLVGGVRMDRDHLEALAGDPDLEVLLAWPDGDHAELAEERAIMLYERRLHRAGQIVRTRHLPLVQEDRLTDAWLLVSHDRGSLRLLVAEIRRRLGLILLVALALALPLAALLSGRVSRPLRDLAVRARDLDLDRLDVDFSTNRRDEVGQLSGILGDLTDRLRRGVVRLRDAERRATLGEVARQVNHDIRNGITPLRNVLRHLGQVADREPAELAGVFRDRQANLDAGLSYLEQLATHYARLSPGRESRPCLLQELVPPLVTQAPAPAGVVVAWQGEPDLPPVLADPVNLRRILENLLRNAVESLPGAGNRVVVTARPDAAGHPDGQRLLIEVTDDGAGIPAEELDRVFNDFYSTKPGGTGLGLSNVRRLVGDLGGTIRVTSEVGRGTTFTIALPIADHGTEGHEREVP